MEQIDKTRWNNLANSILDEATELLKKNALPANKFQIAMNVCLEEIGNKHVEKSAKKFVSAADEILDGGLTEWIKNNSMPIN